MIGFWASGIVISIISQCYASAILCFVFLLNTISEFISQKEYDELTETIEVQKEFIDKCSEIIRRNNE